MAIVKYKDWNPFREMEKLFDWRPSLLQNWEMPEVRFPALDVEDTGDAFVVRAEVPGIKPDDINLEIHGNQLMIRGEKKDEREGKDEEGKYYYRERSFGSFSRTVALGEEIDPEKVRADYKDGVLTVTLEKSEAKKARKIKIKSR